MTADSLWEPAVARFRQRIRDAYVPPDADVLVLLPCSAKKPYRTSKSHRFLQNAIEHSGIRDRCQEVMVTSPLGLVPRELEEVYPAAHYDVPVTGHWTRDEEAVIREQLAALLSKHAYRHVVAHVPTNTYAILRDLLPEGTLHTAGHGAPQSTAACRALEDALSGLAPGLAARASPRSLAELRALASFQFGAKVADSLLADASVKGRIPFRRVLGLEGQRAMTTGGRGLLSLTLDGARIVASHGVARVHIEDFWPKKTSTLFAVGVTGTDPVREGDEVVVVHGDEVRGCGVAAMSGEEMVAMRRGAAVHLRHIAEAA